jgi:hypothetical protein
MPSFTLVEKRHPNHPGELSTDESAAVQNRKPDEIEARARAIDLLMSNGLPFLVGGAYAFCQYTGIYRDTKDLDIFLRKTDALGALEIMAADGYRTELTDDQWIYKTYRGEFFVDFIFSSGNGVAEVDDEWFEHAVRGTAFGRAVFLVPPEELIWSKAFVFERERHDGADVAHIIRSMGDKLNWKRLLRRFERYWEVLLAQLLLFRFAYPSNRSLVPDWVMAYLLGLAVRSVEEGDSDVRVCRGNLLSKANYTLDIQEWGYLDGRAWDELERNRGSGERSDIKAAAGGGRRSALP